MLKPQFEMEFEFSDVWSFEWRRIKRAIGVGFGEEKKKTQDFFFFFCLQRVDGSLAFTFCQGRMLIPVSLLSLVLGRRDMRANVERNGKTTMFFGWEGLFGVRLLKVNFLV